MTEDSFDLLHSRFEKMAHVHTESGTECWYARELQEPLGYNRWESFSRLIARAVISCERSGNEVSDHFQRITKMIPLGNGGERLIEDVVLSRYACYLVAQNGDSSKEPIAYAQSYFAVQTRKQEIVQQRMAQLQRLEARRRLSSSEKVLSGIINERLSDPRSFGRIRSKGDQQLFGGYGTNEMKERLGVPENRPLADFLPIVTIRAKDLANEITNPTSASTASIRKPAFPVRMKTATARYARLSPHQVFNRKSCRRMRTSANWSGA